MAIRSESLPDSFDTLATSLIAMADARSTGQIEMSAPRIDIGRVISSSPVRVKVLSLQLTLEEEDFTTAHGYTPAVGHVVVVMPIYSGGYFLMRASG